MYLGYFCNTKCQRGFKSTLAFVASRRTCRPTAVFIIQATWSYTKPASREACRRAAVTSPPSSFPTTSPAPFGRGLGCRGTTPARAAVTPKSTFMSPEHPARLRQAVRRQGLRPCLPSGRRFLPRSCPGAFRCLRRAQNARSARCQCSRRSPWRSRP